MHTNKIRRIHNHRHLPKYILNAKKRRQDQAESKFNKRVNKEANTGVKEEVVKLKEAIVEGIEFREEKVPRVRKGNKKDGKEKRAENFGEEQEKEEQINREEQE